jgi:hypothetical protein
MVWQVAGVWQPAVPVFVGDVPMNSWQAIHVDLSGVAPTDAEGAAVGFRPGFGDGLLEIYAVDNVAVGLETAVGVPPGDRGFSVLGVHPNPANPRVAVEIRLEQAGPAKITIYDLSGRKVRTLFDGALDAGLRQEAFDGRDESGRLLGSGTYIVRLETPGRIASRQLTFVR